MSLIKRTIRLAYADATLREPLLRAVLDSYGEIKIAARPKGKTVHEPTAKQRREQAQRAEEEQVGRERALRRQMREEEDERKMKGEDLDDEANVGYEKKDTSWIKENMFSFEGVRLDAGGEPFNFKMYLNSKPNSVKEWDKAVGELAGKSDVPNTHPAKDPQTGKLNKINSIVSKAEKKDEWALGILIPFYQEYEEFILAKLEEKSTEHTSRAIAAMTDKDYKEIAAALDKIDWRKVDSQIKEGIVNVADALKKMMVRGQIIETANPIGSLITRVIETTCKATELGVTQGALVYAGVNAAFTGSVDGTMLSAAAITGAFALAALAESKTRPAEGGNQNAAVAYLRNFLSPESFKDNLSWALSQAVMSHLTGVVIGAAGGAVGALGNLITPNAAKDTILEGFQSISDADALACLNEAEFDIEPELLESLPKPEDYASYPVDKKLFSEAPEVPTVKPDAAKMNEEVLVALARNAKGPITRDGLKALVKKTTETVQNAVGYVFDEIWQGKVMEILQNQGLEAALDEIEKNAFIDPEITRSIRKMFSSALEQEDAKMSTSAVPAAVNQEYRGRLVRLVKDLDKVNSEENARSRRVIMRKVHKDLKKLAADYVTEGESRVQSSLGRSPTLKGVNVVKTKVKSLFEQAQEANQQEEISAALSRSASTLKYAKLNEELGKLNEYQFGAVLFKLIRDTHYHASLTEFMEDHADEIAEAIKEASQGITEEKLKEAFKKAAKDMTAEGRVSDEDQIEELIENFKSSVEPDKKSIKKSSWKAELDIEF